MRRTSKSKAIERLQKALATIPELKHLEQGSSKFKKWRRNTKVVITNTFGHESDHIKEFNRISFYLPMNRRGTPKAVIQSFYLNGLESAVPILESMIEEIEEYWEEENRTSTPSEFHKDEQIHSNEVFIIHGRDDGTKQTVARFLEKLDLTPVILHDKASLGRTLIEKFEEHAQVGFAVALLTPDDVGSLKGEETNLNPRARQNVIFEFGFFIGRLGRRRVCALTKGNVELPSDYDGVVYVELDAGGAWKINLVRELKATGLDVDANLAL